ncbi:MAG: Rrf2 family transcriptional regulator [Bacteroidetes bacterium]|jgi:Rrf2 family protein|nr:Rrf2 family transcriptional regulator [Bacteroidota bacterium]
MLSNTSKYAIRACIYLAIHSKDNEKIGIKQISEDLHIPTPFLGKILQSLAKYKLLVSTKGPHGGFALSKSPENITLLDIVKVVDGEDIFTNCLLSEHKCEDESEHCPVHEKYATVRNNFTEMFRGQNLAQLAQEVKDSKVDIIL